MRREKEKPYERDWANKDARPGTTGWFKRGRWQIERERCGLDSKTPEPPFKEAERLSEGVHGALGKIGLEGAAPQSALIDEWPEFIGEEVARHTRPGNFRNGVLTIFVRGAVWYSELRRHGERLIRDKIAARLGDDKIKRVVLRPDPE